MSWEKYLEGIDLAEVKSTKDIANHIKGKLKEGKSKIIVDSSEEPAWIPKARLDTEITKRKNAEDTIKDLEEDIKENEGAKEKVETFEKEKKDLEDKIATIEKQNVVREGIRSYKLEAHNADDLINNYIDLDAIKIKDGKAIGLTEVLDDLAKEKEYLYKPKAGGTQGPGQPGSKKDLEGTESTLGDKLAKGAFAKHKEIEDAQNDFFK